MKLIRVSPRLGPLRGQRATIREPGSLTITSDYASSAVRRFFDLRSPVAELSADRGYLY
jgi:hypothetical protein